METGPEPSNRAGEAMATEGTVRRGLRRLLQRHESHARRTRSRPHKRGGVVKAAYSSSASSLTRQPPSGDGSKNLASGPPHLPHAVRSGSLVLCSWMNHLVPQSWHTKRRSMSSTVRSCHATHIGSCPRAWSVGDSLATWPDIAALSHAPMRVEATSPTGDIPNGRKDHEASGTEHGRCSTNGLGELCGG